jgi:NAD+ kinase
MKIALYFNKSKSHVAALALEVYRFLSLHGCTVFTEYGENEWTHACSLTAEVAAEIDYTITLGGDGTILRTFHMPVMVDAPILAINLGGFGFMADVSASEIQESLKKFLNKEFSIQHRIMMEGISHRGERCFAVNEVVVHRGLNPSLIDLAIYVDGVYLNTFSADGVIISTPTGSTAYSLSAGGPILNPELRALVLTPISAHTISNRPIVFMPEDNVQIKYVSNLKDIIVTADGYSSFQMEFGSTYTIVPSSKVFRLITLEAYNYPHILREKLGWARKLKV